MTGQGSASEVSRLVEGYRLEEMPREGGLFAQTWRGPEHDGRPTGTAIVVLLDDAAGHVSAPHRLPITEIWHFHAGDPLRLLLLRADGRVEHPVLGPVVDAGHEVQVVVPAGCWMAARVDRPRGWSLFGCTMTPGFLWQDYEAPDLERLVEEYPEARVELEFFAARAVADPPAQSSEF